MVGSGMRKEVCGACSEKLKLSVPEGHNSGSESWKNGYGEVKLFQEEGTACAKTGSIREMLGVQVA